MTLEFDLGAKSWGRREPGLREEVPSPDPAQISGPGVLTRFLKALEPGSEMDPSIWFAARRRLVWAVARVLRERGLWNRPPSVLGLPGWPSWQAGARSRGELSEPLEELVSECVRGLLLQRLRTFKAYLRQCSDLDGLVLSSLRNYLHNLHRDCDPLGSRVFELLQEAASSACQAGDLPSLSGAKRISASAFLTSDCGGIQPQEGQLRELVGRWNEHLLPDLVTAPSAERGHLVAELARCLGELEAAELGRVRLGELASLWISDVRSRWQALWDRVEGETPGKDSGSTRRQGLGLLFVRPLEVTPEGEAVQRQRFHALIECVARAIDQQRDPPRTRRYLHTLLRFLRAFALDQVPELAASRLSEDPEALPSDRALAAHLHLPRGLVGSLLDRVRSFLRLCKDQLDGEVRSFLSWRKKGGRRED